jgi:glucan biosynthesis protein C
VRAASAVVRAPPIEWLGNLKVVLIVMIIAIHGVLSYAGLVEVWNYSEFREVTLHPVIEVVLFVLGAPFGFFLISLLFLVAGLLTPGSMRRKGVRRFVLDRLVRLGIPFLLFVFVLEPTLTYALEHPLGDAPGSFVEEYLGGGRKVLDTGPLWFVGVLLVFSLGYAAWVAVSGRDVPLAMSPITLPRVFGLVAAVAVASFLVRLVYPYGSEAGVTDGQFWEWPACLAAFGLGIVASREGWVDAVPERLWGRADGSRSPDSPRWERCSRGRATASGWRHCSEAGVGKRRPSPASRRF